MNKNSFKKEQQKQYEIKMAWLKSEQVETFFAYACIVLFFFISWDSSVNLPFCLIDNKKEKFPQNEIERLHQCSQSFTQVWFPNSLAFFFK